MIITILHDNDVDKWPTTQYDIRLADAHLPGLFATNTTTFKISQFDLNFNSEITWWFDLLNQSIPDVFKHTDDFQIKFKLKEPGKNPVSFLQPDQMAVKLGHLTEELDEINKAYQNNDIVEACDGLIDLIYVAAGTLSLMNAPAKELWNDVHIRNMAKVRATEETIGKRGSTFDVVKPTFWIGPRTEEIINHYNSTCSNND